MAEKHEGPYRVVGRITLSTEEIALGTHSSAESAEAHAKSEHESGRYCRVTVIDVPSQDCLLQLDRPER